MQAHTQAHTHTHFAPRPRQLNKTQKAMLASEEGQLAARLAKQLVTIETNVKAPPVT